MPGRVLLGGTLLLLAFLMVMVSGHLAQLLILLLGWVIMWWQMPRLALLLMMFFSLFSLCISPSNWQEKGLGIWFYYDVLQTSPLYSLARMKVDPWTHPWIYEDSPFHFVAESSQPMTAPVLMVFMAVIFWLSLLAKPAHADN